jgi:hypothetical protein
MRPDDVMDAGLSQRSLVATTVPARSVMTSPGPAVSVAVDLGFDMRSVLPILASLRFAVLPEPATVAAAGNAAGVPEYQGSNSGCRSWV